MKTQVKRIEQAQRPLHGEIVVPGDKSIGHRAVIFASIARGTSRVYNLSGGEDNLRTVEAFRNLGVGISEQDGILVIEGRGWEGLQPPSRVIDCGNSGTTMRLLSGVFAGRPFVTTLDGDASLRQRPMKRVIEPLGQMGASIISRNGKGSAPLEVHGGKLKGIRYATPVASAQVKSAILLAALQAEGLTVVEEPQQSRDHTEIMAPAFGAKIEVVSGGRTVSLKGPQELSAKDVRVPGDLSSAAFFLVAAAMVPGSDVTIRGVGCNPTRSGAIDVLRRMGANIERTHLRQEAGEPVADLRVVGGKLNGVEIAPEMVARTIDEYPALAVAAALAEGVTTICGARELRYKESDRIAAMAKELRKLGARVEEREDGMTIEGGKRLEGASLKSYGDHRVAMALAVAGLSASGGVEIDDTGCADISFPGFFRLLEGLRAS
ncbi:MAG: 3-phosphoshikimate 1-carboxyvinyltransferase [Deltaproteobacteria bacterium RIFCSPLOWO2_12_FULL_60_19]|nr:MAG: 3-phosphoshikimate 1-carboxyvinyltransferase [Deltaproteobacteria bacterium RIFCSPLOWO2_12_FULL_60_19]